VVLGVGYLCVIECEDFVKCLGMVCWEVFTCWVCSVE